MTVARASSPLADGLESVGAEMSRHAPPEIILNQPPSGSQSSAKQLATRPRVSPSELGLTGRQLDVLALMTQGKPNKAICRLLNLAEPTVKNHVTSILRALKVTNRVEAVIAVKEFGWDLPQITKAPAKLPHT